MSLRLVNELDNYADTVGDPPGLHSVTAVETRQPSNVDGPLRSESPFAVLTNSLVMMVDDDPLMLETVQCFLEEAGYRRFITSSQPAEAVALLDEHRPDVLLLDLSMPGISGFDILAQVRAHEHSRYTPVIILTAESGPDAKLRALKLGATDFLTKPVDPSELQLRLQNALAFKAYQDRLADFDLLTGLSNRRKFLSDVSVALENAARATFGCVLLYIDLDRFKQLNDTLGHHVGDRLLCAVSALLQRTLSEVTTSGANSDVRSNAIVARVAGNGFAVLIPDLHFHKKADTATSVARRLMGLFADAFTVDSHEAFLTASIGVAISPNDGKDADALLKHAEMAMYQAKKRGRNCCEFFSDQLNAHAKARSTLEHQLRRAVERDELVLLYQPKVDVASGRITGAETLIRWSHPELGMVSPVKFIPIAEETGLIVEIGQWVLRTACSQAKIWIDQGLPALAVSVNVSGAQFKQGKVWHAVSGALAHSGLPAERLVLELTESILMDNPADSIEALAELREMGVKLSIDDFGTGYSSLSYLSKFPLDELKIDRSFVRGLGTDKHSMAIVGAIISLAKALDLKLVAEGVEAQGQLDYLQSNQCDQYQGYLCSRPAPAHIFANLVCRNDALRDVSRSYPPQRICQ